MKFWIFLIPVTLFSMLKVAAYEEKAVTDRIELLEEQRGYQFKKRKFQGVAEGELLYWKASVDGAAYATTAVVKEAGGAAFDLEASRKTRTPHFDYDPGFRLGLGLQSPYDLFDLDLVWTRFYTEGHDSAHGTFISFNPAPGDKVIVDSIGLIMPLLSTPDSASAKCKIKTNVVDIQLARGIEVSRHFFMRPFFGVRAVDLSMNWRISMERDFQFPSLIDQSETTLKVKNDFRAAGGLIGVDLDWRFAKQFGIQTRGAGALVYGLSQEKTRQEYRFLAAGSSESSDQMFKAKNGFYTLKGLWELFAGVFWEAKFFQDKPDHSLGASKKYRREIVLRIVAGYEFQQWPLIGQKTNFQLSRERERFGLGLQGFTGGAKLVF